MAKEKNRVYIVSSSQALSLAIHLREAISDDFTEVIIWREESELQPPRAIMEMLPQAGQDADFVVIIFNHSDIEINYQKGSDQKAQTRDNSIYEAGFFLNILGSDRCLLITSVSQELLPSALRQFTFQYIKEPENLADSDQCCAALTEAIVKIRETLQDQGKMVRGESMPFLPIAEVMKKERHETEGGELREGYVLVCDAEPFEQREFALQVRRNINLGINYIYFFPATYDNARKICSHLRLMLLNPSGIESTVMEPGKNVGGIISEKKEFILENLKFICQRNSLNIYFVREEPIFRLRIHNASSPEQSRLYLRHGDSPNFVEMKEEVRAGSVWSYFKLFTQTSHTQTSQQKALFRSQFDYDLHSNENENVMFRKRLEKEIKEHFPRIYQEVMELSFEKKKRGSKKNKLLEQKSRT